MLVANPDVRVHRGSVGELVRVEAGLRAAAGDEVRLRRAELACGYEVPVPPFWGARVVERMRVCFCVSVRWLRE